MPACKNCLLPGQVPGTQIDSHGLCNHCHAYKKTDHAQLEKDRALREEDLEKALRDSRGKGEYDCLVCFSGGKDSAYLLYKLKSHYGLKVLAFTTDMNIPPVAWENINRTIEKLQIDFLSYRPPKDFYKKFFSFLLKNQEERGAVRTVCYVCAPLFEAYALRQAVEKKIPLVLAGYSPGQPDPERMEYEFLPDHIARVDWTPPFLRESGLFDESELERFWNPLKYPPGTKFPRYLAPFHAWSYNQEAVMKMVVDLGLIGDSKHANPIHSNCPVNWLLMYSDLKNLGYNPYAPEFSQLIRQGKANRLFWRFLAPLLNFMIRRKVFLGAQVQESMDWLELNKEDLVIRRPKRDEWSDLRRR